MELKCISQKKKKFPSDESFGVIAWTVPTLEQANIYFENIEKEIIERKKNKK